MEVTKVLMLFVAIWKHSLALPIQVHQSAAYAVNKTVLDGEVAFRRTRSAAMCDKCLWPTSPNGTVFVPFVISSIFSKTEKLLINEAMNHFERTTCVKFVNRRAEVDYLSVESEEGCWSYIAKLGGQQKVSLNKAMCMSSGIIQHELMHSLGFYHEQNRSGSDRDKHVEIMWQYIDEGRRSFFQMENTNNLDFSYDYSSIMHSQNTTYTNTLNKATIIPKPDPRVPIGQRLGLSHLDMMKINKLYNCSVCRIKLTDPLGSFSPSGISFGQDSSCLWFIQSEINKQCLP
ncbi:astacin-like metalloendopeptidase isoform X2 [Pelobates fuscus]|uniref:astacin-like metalloendopeptidase isoform X2 n=1 Tax=Pelobates fuscus TaxID=191477 RepID=UPI002FE46AB4